MTFDVSRSFAVVFSGLVVGLVAAGTSAGCSSSSASPSTPEAATVCPATIDTTAGAACNTEGAVCGPTFPCGFATITVICTCTLGTFQCVDGLNQPVAAGDTPSCGDAGGNLPLCPASEGAASIGKCTQPQSGQQCAYAPQCTGGTLAFDRCTCEAIPNGGGFAWECENSCNSGTGPVPDAGGQDAAADVQPGMEAGPSNDAASDAPGDVSSQ
jgi:hypothetical protein